MKFKILAGATLAAVMLSTNALAIEIHNGRLISHTETLTANPKAKFLQKKIDIKAEMIQQLLKKKAKAKSNSTFEYIDSALETFVVYDLNNTPVELNGSANIYIENDYPTKNVYTVQTSLILYNPYNGFVTTVVSIDLVALSPTGNAIVTEYPSFPLGEVAPGYYSGNVQVVVKREDGETQFSTQTMTEVNIPSKK